MAGSKSNKTADQPDPPEEVVDRMNAALKRALHTPKAKGAAYRGTTTAGRPAVGGVEETRKKPRD